MTKPKLKMSLKTKTKRTGPEDQFARDMGAAGIRGYKRNVQFIPGRKFEADFFFPRLKLCVEVDGGLWMPKGGHTSGSGAKRDRERDILAYISGGIMTIRVASDHVKTGEAVEWIKEIIKLRKAEVEDS